MSTNELTQAKARIAALVDEASFVEVGARVKARATDFAMQSQAAQGDGVVTGYATIGGKLVYVYSQDASVLGGSMGEMHAKKIVKLYEMAMKMGAPVIGLLDSAGLRLEEVTDSLEGFGAMNYVQAKASGVIPQIMVVFGKCGGGMAVSAGMADFVFMEEKKSALFVSAPNTLDGNFAEKLNTASAAYQSENTGMVDGFGTEEEILAQVRALVSVLPSNNDDLAAEDGTDDLNRLTENLENVTGISDIASVIADGYDFIEVKKSYGKEMTTGFIRLDGVTCGIVGNAENVLSPNGCDKAASFVTFCDAFEIPVITFVNVKGYSADVASEKTMARNAARLTYAYANATVPKISVVLSEAYGSSYIVMNSKALGADIVYALETSKIGIMDASMAAKILTKDAGKLQETAALFDEKQTADSAAARGVVDDIITMTELRKKLLAALEMLFNKRETAPFKKHGTK